MGPQPSAVADGTRGKRGQGGGADGRREFMCLGRVKGTRVATSAANGRRTAGCNGWRETETGGCGEERTRGRKRGMDAVARPARVIERDEFHSPDRFRREDATRAVSGAGIRGIPGFEKATECRSESRRIPQRRVCRIRQAIESRGFSGLIPRGVRANAKLRRSQDSPSARIYRRSRDAHRGTKSKILRETT